MAQRCARGTPPRAATRRRRRTPAQAAAPRRTASTASTGGPVPHGVSEGRRRGRDTRVCVRCKVTIPFRPPRVARWFCGARAHREDEDDDRRGAERLAHLQRAERKRACSTPQYPTVYPASVPAVLRSTPMEYPRVPCSSLAYPDVPYTATSSSSRRRVEQSTAE